MGRAILVGNRVGLPILLAATPPEAVASLMAASDRPDDLEAVRQLARDHDRTLLVQPSFGTAEYENFVAQFRAERPDVLVCCSYSMLIRPEVLEAVNGRAFNVHPSLLPRNRGPNPVQWAIIKGEPVTGVTLHIMDEGIDTGPIIGQVEEEIRDEDTWVTVSERLHSHMPRLLAEHLPTLLHDATPPARPQDDAVATFNPRLTPESPRIDFATMTDRQVFDLIRAQIRPLGGAWVERDAVRTYFRDYVKPDEVASLRARFA